MTIYGPVWTATYIPTGTHIAIDGHVLPEAAIHGHNMTMCSHVWKVHGHINDHTWPYSIMAL